MQKYRILIALGLTLGLLAVALMGWPIREAARAQGPMSTLLPPGFSTLMPTGVTTSVATFIPPGAATMIPKTPVAPPGGGGVQPPQATASPQATAAPQATATPPPTAAPTLPPRAAQPTPKAPSGPCPSGALLPGLLLGGVFVTWSLRRR